MLAVSWKTGWPGATPAAIHPGWPGGRRVYRRVGVRSLLTQQRHAQSVQTCRSCKTAPHYRQRVGRLTPSMIRSSDGWNGGRTEGFPAQSGRRGV
jgi:hypothetical protein